MPNYPSTIPRLTSVTPLNATPVDVADGGGVRIASLAAIQKYRIDIEHNAITSIELDELMAFWAEYQNQQIALVRADRMVYYAPFVNEPEYREINGARYDVKVQLDGRRIPSVVATGYGSFESSPTVTKTAGDTTISFDTSVYKFGSRSLKLTKNSADAASTVFYLAGSDVYNVTITPNRVWMFIASVRMSGLRSIAPALRRSTTGSYVQASSGSYAVPVINTWHRFARIIDMSAYADTSCAIAFTWPAGATASGETMNMDGTTLIDVTDLPEITESNFPTVYIPPEP